MNSFTRIESFRNTKAEYRAVELLILPHPHRFLQSARGSLSSNGNLCEATSKSKNDMSC